MKVRKAVIPAAGRGIRFLPVTKTQPKEMLPLLNKPLIHYSVEEILNSGINQIIIVTSFGKQAIEDYFDRSFDLEQILEMTNQTILLEKIRELSSLVDIYYIRQKEQLGLGHAVLTTKNIIGDEAFAVLLPDDIVVSEVPALKQMIKIYERYESCVIAFDRINSEDISRYGTIKPGRAYDDVYQINNLVEKPIPSEAPSDMGIIGRYILTPQIFNILESTLPGINGEIQLTDALKLLLKHQTVYAYELDGIRYDTGTPQGWLEATVDLALKHPDFGDKMRAYLHKLL